MRMKKIIPFILFGLIFSSCSGGIPNLANLIASPTAPAPVDTPTPLPTVTLIPTQDLFATLTATPITVTPIAVTPAETSLIPDLPTLAPIPLPTFSQQIINDISDKNFFSETAGFRGIIYSGAILYWNEGPCMPRNVKFTVFVENPDRTDRVFLFLRLRDKKNTLNVGEWSAGAEMIKIDDGSFNYKVETRHLRRYYYYKEAWIEYQFVAIDEDLQVIGRTQLFDRNISLVKCGPVSSP